jgi:hypothetical protein
LATIAADRNRLRKPVERARIVLASADRGRCSLWDVLVCFGMMPEQTEAEQDFAPVRSAIATNSVGAVRFFASCSDL